MHIKDNKAHQEEDSVDVKDIEVDGLLSFADGAQHQPSNLVAPPLQPNHEDPGNGQLDEGPPVLHGLPGPPSPRLLVEPAGKHVHEDKHRGKPLTYRHGNDGTPVLCTQAMKPDSSPVKKVTYVKPSLAPANKPTWRTMLITLEINPTRMNTRMMLCVEWEGKASMFKRFCPSKGGGEGGIFVIKETHISS